QSAIGNSFKDEAMNHRVLALAFLMCGLVGCAHTQTRAQSDEDNERDKEFQIKTIGDLTTVGNADSEAVSGVGLMTNLSGTGGGNPPGQLRAMVDHLLQQKGLNSKEILDSRDNAIVLVSALIPPGARKGDPLDVDVTLPPGSKASSLKGGKLQECFLYNYDST